MQSNKIGFYRQLSFPRSQTALSQPIYRVILSVFLFESAFIMVTRVPQSFVWNPRLLAFNILFLLWLIMEASRVRLGHRKAKTYGKFSRSFLIVSVSCLLLAVLESSSGNRLGGGTWMYLSMAVGTCMFSVGVYLRHLSIRTLGKYFVTKVQIAEEHQLVTHGIYSVIRHPSYTGLILGFLGLLIFSQSILGILTFIFLALPLYLYRITIEERALIEAFREQYVIYRKNTYRLLPRVF